MTHILKLNRSLAYLKLGYYDKALEDAKKDTADTQRSEKGLYRAALSLYELGRFQESHQALESLLSRYPDCNAAKQELLRAKMRLSEQEHGDYDFRAMYKAAERVPPNLDDATFAKNVEVRASEGRGLGLFTTKNVSAGELLLCGKAFSYCSANHSKTSVRFNTHTKEITMGTQANLITAVVQRLFRNPSLIPMLTSLHHGDYQPVDGAEVDSMPVIDTFLIERIVSLNGFGCPRTSLEMHTTKQASKPQDQSEFHHTTGIFIKASFINHSCKSNAQRSFIGDMQIVRATQGIPEGSEIFFWYVIPEPEYSHDETIEKLKRWGFQCTCAICQQSKKTKKNEWVRRLGLLKDLTAAMGMQNGVDLPKIGRLLDAIGKTYAAPAFDVPRLALCPHYLFLASKYSSLDQQDKVIEAAWKTLTSLGFKAKWETPQSLKSPFEIEQWGLGVDYVIKTWVYLWTAYAKVAPHLCKNVERYAKLAYKMNIGEDATFDETIGKVAHQAIFEGKSLEEQFKAFGF